jgi:hypothetical protein
MQQKSIKSVGSWVMLAVLSLAAMVVCSQSAVGQDQGNKSAPTIEGGWLFTVVVPPGTPGPPSFQALDVFSKGGGWVGHASTDRATNWSPVYGSWKRVSERIVITQYQFAEDSSGMAIGTVIVHKEVHFTGPDSIAGTSSVSFCDLNESNCFTPPGRANVSAVRIKASGPLAP